jgi:epoxide hydrolase-like predicted phosphatase
MKKEENEIKAIIFDIGGVLQLGEKQKKSQKQKHASGIHETVAKKLKIGMDQYFDAIDTAYALSTEGKITKKKLLQIFSKNLKISSKKLEKIYFKTYLKKFKFNKQLFKQAIKLKKLGYKIAILSDQWHLSKDAHFPKQMRESFFPAIISCDVGMRKPNPLMYKLVLKKLKLKPRETLFIDNQKWNTQPAKKLGIKTIQFKDNKQLFKAKQWLGLFEGTESSRHEQVLWNKLFK